MLSAVQMQDPERGRVHLSPLRRPRCSPSGLRWAVIGFLLGLAAFATSAGLHVRPHAPRYDPPPPPPPTGRLPTCRLLARS